MRQASDIDSVPGNFPIDFLNRGVVCDPSLGPTIESRHDKFIGVVGVAWCKRLKLVQGVKIAYRPRHEGSQSADGEENCRGENCKDARTRSSFRSRICRVAPTKLVANQ